MSSGFIHFILYAINSKIWSALPKEICGLYYTIQISCDCLICH